MNIQQLIQHKLATPAFGSYRAIAARCAALGHTVPKESSIEHWGAGSPPIKRLPAHEAIVGLADAFGIPPSEVRTAFLTSMGVLTIDRPGSLLVSLLPDGVEHLDGRPDLLETILKVTSMAIARAIREETASPATQPKTTPTPKKPPAKAAKKTTTTRRATTPTPRRTRANG